MREQTLIKAFEMHDRAINGLMREFRALQKVLDKTYVQSLTHVMMWDVLFELLQAKGVFTKDQFDAALKDLSDKTKAAMEANQKKEVEEMDKDKTTVISPAPAFSVDK